MILNLIFQIFHFECGFFSFHCILLLHIYLRKIHLFIHLLCALLGHIASESQEVLICYGYFPHFTTIIIYLYNISDPIFSNF